MFTAGLFVFMFGPWIIDHLRLRQGKGQPIREDGPQSHVLTKKGTPTMGGLMIFPACWSRHCCGRTCATPMREHDHRLAEVEGLGRGVVAAVGDHQVDERQDGRLGQEHRADHVVWAGGTARCWGPWRRRIGGASAQDVDEAPHEVDIGRAEDPARGRPGPRRRPDLVREVPAGSVGADAGVQAAPRRGQRLGAGVVRLGRVEVQVEEGRLVDEGRAFRALAGRRPRRRARTRRTPPTSACACARTPRGNRSAARAPAP